MQQGKELWYDALYLVGYEYLVAVELNLITLQFDVRLDFGEVEDTRQIEGLIHVEVDPEERFIAHGIERTVEALVILILQ